MESRLTAAGSKPTPHSLKQTECVTEFYINPIQQFRGVKIGAERIAALRATVCVEAAIDFLLARSATKALKDVTLDPVYVDVLSANAVRLHPDGLANLVKAFGDGCSITIKSGFMPHICGIKYVGRHRDGGKSGMTIGAIDESQRKAATVVGFCYLFALPPAVFAEFYVLGRLLVYNNAVDTARNIMAHERLFRLGTA